MKIKLRQFNFDSIQFCACWHVVMVLLLKNKLQPICYMTVLNHSNSKLWVLKEFIQQWHRKMFSSRGAEKW